MNGGLLSSPVQSVKAKMGRLPAHRLLFLFLLFLLPIQLGRHFWPNFAYVLGLKVDYLSPTVYLTDILVLAILFLSLPTDFRLKISDLRKHWWILAFFVFLFVNAILAQNAGAALYKFFKILQFYLLGVYISKNNYTLKVVYYPLSLAVVYSSLIALAQFIKQSSLNGFFWFLGERTFNAGTLGIAKAVYFNRLLMRPYATFSHPNVLAGFILVSLFLTTSFLFKKSKTFSAGYLLLATSVLVLAYSRSVYLLILGFCCWKTLKSKKWRLAFGCLLITTFILFWFFCLANEEAVLQRVQLTKVAFLLIKEHPLIGVGLNNFIPRLPEFWPGPLYWLQPVHNYYLLIMVETGFIGLLIFLWFVFLTFKKLKPKQCLLTLSLVTILLLGLTDHYWFTLQQTQLLFTLVIGLIWAKKPVLE